MSDWRVLDLFSGIGGFSLGLERAGMQTVAFCENDGYARRVLHKHWPTTWIYDDVQTLTKQILKKDGIFPNVICGGFPCQDISTSGKGAGLDGARSGLWKHMHRLIREVRPRVAIMENVAILRSRGLDHVLGDLAAIGYNAEWHCIPAGYVGAPHNRDRIWIMAYPHGKRLQWIFPSMHAGASQASNTRENNGALALSNEPRALCQSDESPIARQDNICLEIEKTGRKQWAVKSRPVGVVNGIPHRLDRLRCAGNAVVPQLVEWLGRSIIARLPLIEQAA